MLFSYGYLFRRGGRGTRDGNWSERASKTFALLGRVHDEIDRLWSYADELRRDRFVGRMVEAVIEIEEATAAGSPVEPSLEELQRRWKAWTGVGLTPGQLRIVVKPLVDDGRLAHQGKSERAKYRVGKLLGLSKRRVHDLVKMDPPEAFHFWGHQQPLTGGPTPEIAQYFVVMYFFEEVLGWPLEEIYQRLDELLGFGGSELPALPNRDRSPRTG